MIEKSLALPSKPIKKWSTKSSKDIMKRSNPNKLYIVGMII